MNNETKERTAARVLTTIGTVLAVWKVVFEFVLAEVEEVWIAALIATLLACGVVAVDAWTTYYNNDYTDEGQVGTMVTRHLKEDPTLVVEVIDGDADEEDDDTDEVDPDDEGDDVIEEGEEDEVEQR